MDEGVAILYPPVSSFHPPDTFCMHKTIRRIIFAGGGILFRVTGAAAVLSASCKEANIRPYQFFSAAVETHGAFSSSALSFLTTLGERLTGNSGDLRQTSYVFQRLSVIIQLFNSVLIHDSFVSAHEEPDL